MYFELHEQARREKVQRPTRELPAPCIMSMQSQCQRGRMSHDFRGGLSGRPAGGRAMKAQDSFDLSRQALHPSSKVKASLFMHDLLILFILLEFFRFFLRFVDIFNTINVLNTISTIYFNIIHIIDFMSIILFILTVLLTHTHTHTHTHNLSLSTPEKMSRHPVLDPAQRHVESPPKIAKP